MHFIHKLLLLLIAGSLFILAPGTGRTAPPHVAATETASQTGRLRMFHTHTGEHIDIVYRRGGSYVQEALDKLDYFLRDHRTGEVRHYDPRVFDLLESLAGKLGNAETEIHVICGYRTPWSNEYLRTRGPHTGVAQHSLHMQAQAIDIRFPGVSTAAVRTAALGLGRGGVGYYPESNFVHVDVGRVRAW